MQQSFFRDKTELPESLNETSRNLVLFCVSALSWISYLQSIIQLLGGTFLLSSRRRSGFMLLSHRHFWPNLWRPYLFFSCQSRPNLSGKKKYTDITQHCVFFYFHIFLALKKKSVWILQGGDRRVYQTTLAYTKSHDNACQLYSSEEPNLQMLVLIQIFRKKFSCHILLYFCKLIFKERAQSSLKIWWSKSPPGLTCQATAPLKN